MKKLLYLSLSIFLASCGGSGGSDDEKKDPVSNSSTNSSLSVASLSQSSELSSVDTSISSLASSMQSNSMNSLNGMSSSRSSRSRSSSSRSSSLANSSQANSSTNSSLSEGVFVPAPPVLSEYSCEHEGNGTDYQVGPGKQYTKIIDVPWENLDAGDTVRIFYRAEPYREQIAISGFGTESQPIRVCGVAGPNGERPIISGTNMATRSTNRIIAWGTGAPVLVSRKNGDAKRPEHVIVEGLYITTERTSADDGADCIRLQTGSFMTIRNNAIVNCQNGIFSQQKLGEEEVTTDLLVEKNYFSENSGNDRAVGYATHNLYLQSIRTTIQFNHLGPLHSDGTGTNIKSRGLGNVIRYNYLEGGSYIFDLVNIEQYVDYVLEKPEDRALFENDYIYGNVVLNETSWSDIHHGADNDWAGQRYGNLWVFNNTIIKKGNFFIGVNGNTVETRGDDQLFIHAGCGYEYYCNVGAKIYLFNNVHVQARYANYLQTFQNLFGGNFTLHPNIAPMFFTLHKDIPDLNVGTNFFSATPYGFRFQHKPNTEYDVQRYDDVGNSLNPITSDAGTFSLAEEIKQSLIVDPVPPIDLTTFKPLANSPILNKGEALPTALEDFPVEFQYDGTTQTWVPRATTNTLGAVE